MKRRYVWTGERFVETPPEDRLTYADRLKVEEAIRQQEQERQARDGHPGTYR